MEAKVVLQRLVEMAAKQAALRKALSRLPKENKNKAKEVKNSKSIIDQMDKTEYDLVNKRLNAETLKRQQEILTKLLDAERADREQEFDEQRKSEELKYTQNAPSCTTRIYQKKTRRPSLCDISIQV